MKWYNYVKISCDKLNMYTVNLRAVTGGKKKECGGIDNSSIEKAK